jgi:hypothetical protein
MTTGVIYYTDSRLEDNIAPKVREQLRKAFPGQIVACSLEPLDFGDVRLVLPLERSYLTMFKQILAALEVSTADFVFHAEHDVLYDASHFDFTPPEKDKFYYDLNWWKVRADGLAVHWEAAQVSGLVAYRELLIDYYEERVRAFNPDNFDRKFEPASGSEGLLETWRAPVPHIDIRHDTNLTFNKWRLEHFRKKDTAVNFQSKTIDDIEGWDSQFLKGILN